jgi:hypothetical protein
VWGPHFQNSPILNFNLTHYHLPKQQLTLLPPRVGPEFPPEFAQGLALQESNEYSEIEFIDCSLFLIGYR